MWIAVTLQRQGKVRSGVPPWGCSQHPARHAGLGLWHRLTSHLPLERRIRLGLLVTLTLAPSWRGLPRQHPPLELAPPFPCASEH